MPKQEDWTRWLTVEEREILAGWDDEDTTRFAHSLAASRALVAEKDKAISKYAIHEDGCLGRIHGDCDCGLNSAFALTEKEIMG